MFQFMRGIALILVSCGASFAEDDESANDMMPACRDFINSSSDTTPFSRGVCAGTIGTILAFGRHVGTHCAPLRVSNGQALRVVIQYIDKQPARLHEKFGLLAIEAMQEAWPCKK
jgi:Rap1a immunity proteins